VKELTILEALDCRKGKKLVFTNGVFDILHAGHVTYLQSARELGDLLIVGLNSDESVRTLGKGPDRPINTTADRVTVVAALRCVDGVVVFTEKTPENLIELLKPEVHVKGGDYKIEDLPESAIVHSYGGQVVILPLLAGRSTTLTLQALKED
jgi:glycerol-3-phosphate cytidylyltransferase